MEHSEGKNKTEMQPLGPSSSNLVGSRVQGMVGPLNDPTDLGIRAPREGTWRLVYRWWVWRGGDQKACNFRERQP